MLKTRQREELSSFSRPTVISLASVRQACRWSNANFTQPQATSEPTKCLVGGNGLFASVEPTNSRPRGIRAAKIDQAWPIYTRASSMRCQIASLIQHCVFPPPLSITSEKATSLLKISCVRFSLLRALFFWQKFQFKKYVFCRPF